MLYINPDSLKIRNANKIHLEQLIDLLYVRIDKLKNRHSIYFFNEFIINDLEKIVSGKPSQLIDLSDSINRFLGQSSTVLHKSVKSVFNYDWFIDKVENRYSGYDLAKQMDQPTCTYCNRNYTSTVITKKGRKIIRPQFDHYFDKKKHPLLALSFYNLIPCCSICNTSIKHRKHFSLKSHIHPYIDDVEAEFKFSYSYQSDPYFKNGLKVDLKVDSDLFVMNFLRDMEIEEVYGSHTDVLYDMIYTKQAYSDRYLSILEESVLEGFKMSKQEIYRLVFGVYMDKENFEKRPFSKFRLDILKELGIV